MQTPLHCSILIISGTSLSFAYDAGGLRTGKTVNGTTYRYFYASGKLMRLSWGSNTVDFFYDANGTPYSMKYNGALYYYVTNLQGDIMRIVNTSGTVVASYDYDPYGKVISATGTMANVNPLRYRGYVYDQETGFYYLQRRYYDPEICRFINADSFMSTGQGILGNNMFAYCLNDPVNYVDSDDRNSEALQWWGTGMAWLPFADSVLPIGDIIYVSGLLILGAFSFASSKDNTPQVSYDVADSAYGSPSPDDDDDDDYYNDESNFGGRQRTGQNHGNTPRNNQAQNKQFDDATKGLTRDQKRFLHNKISKQGKGYHEIRAFAKDLFVFVVGFFAFEE